ncbi:hypothetical protein VTP01DRAFT_930 [Rhizomucor pusillus]|uniref:uncharacterized protein n=1 Tax=Rhizomucor pusillus TaxID=4840 RepID=UPI0037421A6A
MKPLCLSSFVSTSYFVASRCPRGSLCPGPGAFAYTFLLLHYSCLLFTPRLYHFMRAWELFYHRPPSGCA